MHPLFAFVDEYGDPSLETQKSGVSDHFVVVAVMVQPTERETLDTAIEVVRRKHFQTGEMESSNGVNPCRWTGGVAWIDQSAASSCMNTLELLGRHVAQRGV